LVRVQRVARLAERLFTLWMWSGERDGALYVSASRLRKAGGLCAAAHLRVLLCANCVPFVLSPTGTVEA